MLYTDHSLRILTLLSYKGIGKAWIVSNYSTESTTEDLIDKLNFKLKV